MGSYHLYHVTLLTGRQSCAFLDGMMARLHWWLVLSLTHDLANGLRCLKVPHEIAEKWTGTGGPCDSEFISKKKPAYNCLTMPYYALLSQ